MWLKIGPTNNNPKVVGSYFLSSAKASGGEYCWKYMFQVGL